MRMKTIHGFGAIIDPPAGREINGVCNQRRLDLDLIRSLTIIPGRICAYHQARPENPGMSRHFVAGLIMTDRLLMIDFSIFYFLLSTEHLLRGCGPMVHDGLASKRSGRRAKFKVSGQSLIVMTIPPALAMEVQTFAVALGHRRLELCFFSFFSRLILTELDWLRAVLFSCCTHLRQREHRG